MNTLTTLRYGFVLAVLGSQLSHAADTNAIGALKAVPRGSETCWTEVSGRLKNTCATAQYLSFMADFNANGRSVNGSVVADGQVTCESVIYTLAATNYIVYGNKGVNSPLPGGFWSCAPPPGTSPGPFYEIDVKVPSGVTVAGAILQALP